MDKEQKSILRNKIILSIVIVALNLLLVFGVFEEMGFPIFTISDAIYYENGLFSFLLGLATMGVLWCTQVVCIAGVVYLLMHVSNIPASGYYGSHQSMPHEEECRYATKFAAWFSAACYLISNITVT